MKTYNINMPFCGFVSQAVEAESEEEALEKFYEKVSEANDVLKNVDHYEWDFHKSITKGNVFYGALNEMEIEDLGEFED